MILFGGAGLGEKPLGDTWTYDYDTNTWAELTPQPTPSARGWHAMAYDSDSGAIVLFGGGVDREHFMGDTWVFDPARRVWFSAP